MPGGSSGSKSAGSKLAQMLRVAVMVTAGVPVGNTIVRPHTAL